MEKLLADAAGITKNICDELGVNIDATKAAIFQTVLYALTQEYLTHPPAREATDLLMKRGEA